MKRAMQSALRLGAKGLKVAVRGRLGGNENARTEWLRDGNEDYRKEIQTSIGVVHELGSPVFICGASINERGLTASMKDYQFTNSSAPKRISQVVSKGWQLAIF